jgi:hypothetical protein
MPRAAIAAIACVGLAAGLFGVSWLVLDHDESEDVASQGLTRLPRAPVSVPPPTPVRGVEERRRESPQAELRLLHSQSPRRGTAPGLRWGVDPTTVRVVAEHPDAS